MYTVYIQLFQGFMLKHSLGAKWQRETDSSHEEMLIINAKFRMIILAYGIGSEENTLWKFEIVAQKCSFGYLCALILTCKVFILVHRVYLFIFFILTIKVSFW